LSFSATYVLYWVKETCLHDVTAILHRVGEGQPRAVDELIQVVYGELRRMAERSLRQESPGHTLQPTALVHEAYLRLVDTDAQTYESRAHFFASAATAIRHILIDHARRRSRLKRGGDRRRLPLDELLDHAPATDRELIALDEALAELGEIDPHKARIVELRYFAGLTVDEVATALKMSPSTIARDWRMARAWLSTRLQGDER
jgi:RNA polymerase sigma factor (TIGR02999 family)